jgi:hypothetical protein
MERFVLSVLQPWRAGDHNRELFRLSARAGRVLFAGIRAAVHRDNDKDKQLHIGRPHTTTLTRLRLLLHRM